MATETNEQTPANKPAETTGTAATAGTPAINQLTTVGKWLAGILLIIFTAAPAYIIFAYWPDRQPEPKSDILPWYTTRAFHVRLAGVHDSMYLSRDSTKKDSTAKVSDSAGAVAKRVYHGRHPRRGLIHLNTLLLILVAAGGFLGNMIHISTSLTTFVGNGQFKSNWILWYFVKPFTAAALALGLYFVFRAGFLNMSADLGSINLYGVITISFLTGLYTDRATMKLHEVINTVFGIKDGGGRKDPLATTGGSATGGTQPKT